MDLKIQEKFKTKLKTMETELQEALEAKSEDTAPVQVDPSIGRLSRMDAIQGQQMARELKARQEQALLRVRNAMEALRNGHYGQCRRCRRPIGLERLEAQPDAVVCVACADRSQRN